VSVTVILRCDCREDCMDVVGGLSVPDARANAWSHGWDVDTIQGTTVDFAPGHGLNGRAA
jgi:hypothetical protein